MTQTRTLMSEEDGGATMEERVDHQRKRYPHCVVWTPIPVLTWLFPFIGHMGIATSGGVIRDFAGPYFVSEDDMAFGWPSRFWQLPLGSVAGGSTAWDKAVAEASAEYGHRMHNLCCDNCHSHVAMALNEMAFGGSKSWNMIWLALYILLKGSYVGVGGFLKQWLPFLCLLTIVAVIVITSRTL